jgi:hypothetical protein
MSKWINKELFSKYTEEKEKETTEKSSTMRRSEFVWQSPQAGTSEKAKVYEGRFLPDKNGRFTKKYFYHMWKSGDKWNFYLCPKTHDIGTFCPVCSVVSSLYTGTTEDKQTAFKMKRKERHVGNFYIVDDPRDKETDDATKHVNGKVKLYEFPSKLESKVKNEILDTKEGLGLDIFDPGEDGHNIIIKIKSTKPDAKGNTYPDYADSIFSRKANALASNDKGIKEIMESTYSIDDYIKGLEISKEDTIALLKKELLWDMVESEWNKNNGSPITVKNNVVEDVPEDIALDVESLTEDDLMAELRSMA